MTTDLNERLADIEAFQKGNSSAIRLLTMLLVDDGTIERDKLETNADLWLEHMKPDVAAVFRSVLNLDLDDETSPNPWPQLRVIQGDKKDDLK